MGNPYHDAVGKFASKGGRVVTSGARSVNAGARKLSAGARVKAAEARAYEAAHPKTVRAAKIGVGVAATLAPELLPGIGASFGAYTMTRAASNRSRYAYAAAKGLGAVPKATKATRGVYRITKV